MIKMKKIEWGKDPYFYGPRQYFRQSLLISYIKKAKGKVLDAGCGNGSQSFRISKKGYCVTGIDISKSNIEFCNKIKKSIQIKNVSFMQMDLLNIKLPKKSFDTVVSGEVIEHIKEDDKVVKNFNKVLKIGGHCIITTCHNPKLWSFEDEWYGHVRRYKADELRNLFLRNGFKIEKMRFFGFPLMRIYLYLFKFVLKKKVGNEKKRTKKKSYSGIMNFLSYLFFFDNLFSWCSLGNGLVLRAVKIKDLK